MNGYIESIDIIPIKSIHIKKKIEKFLNDEKYHIYTIDFPNEYHSLRHRKKLIFLQDENAIQMVQYLKENHADIYYGSCHGDFILHGNIIGKDHLKQTLYIIEKKDNMMKIREIDLYCKISDQMPCDLIPFENVIPGYFLDLKKEDEKCDFYFNTNNLYIDLDFLKKKEMKDFEFTSFVKYQSFDFQNHKILILYPLNMDTILSKSIEKNDYQEDNFKCLKVKDCFCSYFDNLDIPQYVEECLRCHFGTLKDFQNLYSEELNKKTYTKIQQFVHKFDYVYVPLPDVFGDKPLQVEPIDEEADFFWDQYEDWHYHWRQELKI